MDWSLLREGMSTQSRLLTYQIWGLDDEPWSISKAERSDKFAEMLYNPSAAGWGCRVWRLAEAK